MIRSIAIQPDPQYGTYTFTRYQDLQKRKIWYEVTTNDGKYEYKLGRIISGNGFEPYEGTIIRTHLIEALKTFFDTNIGKDATTR